MILKAIIDDQIYTLNVPETVLARGLDFFAKLDADMDKGWQMSREWVDRPDKLQRCQIAADKLLTALEEENQRLGMLMAGYILHKLPDLDTVDIDIQGEIQNTAFTFKQGEDSPPRAEQPPAGGTPAGMGKMEALEQAGHDVTQVFKVGKSYRFSVYDHASGTWQDSPAIASEDEAERLRQEALKQRFEQLQRPEAS